VTLANGEAMRATRLMAAAKLALDRMCYFYRPYELADIEHYIALARDQLGEKAFAAVWAIGQTLTLEETAAEALAHIKQIDTL
jgi:predicted homoserine dehydrogenase-like protein